LPVLLNMHDPNPGPLLLISDPGAGKTAFLRICGKALIEMHPPQEAQFAVITNHVDEWEDFTANNQTNCIGVFPAYHDSAVDLISSLSAWAQRNRTPNQSIILMIDDINCIDKMDFDIKQTFRWLLSRAPTRRLWPLVTMTASDSFEMESWLPAFRTRIYGKIDDCPTALYSFHHGREPLESLNHMSFSKLHSGVQFALREGNDLLRFWIPEQ